MSQYKIWNIKKYNIIGHKGGSHDTSKNCQKSVADKILRSEIKYQAPSFTG